MLPTMAALAGILVELGYLGLMRQRFSLTSHPDMLSRQIYGLPTENAATDTTSIHDISIIFHQCYNFLNRLAVAHLTFTNSLFSIYATFIFQEKF